jgi:protein phosphatase
MIGLVLLVLAIVAAGFIGYQWTQSRFFVGESPSGKVAVFQGVQQDLGPIRLSHVYEESSIRVDRLPAYDKQLVEQTINADDLSSARAIVEQLSDAGGE